MPLKIEKISKRFDNNWVLRDVGFEAADGEIFGVFGANGAGKSVLLRIIGGSEPSNGGTVAGTQNGVSIFEMPKPSILGSVFGRTPKTVEHTERATQFKAFVESAAGILVLDEPFDGLDEPVRRECVEHLRAAASGRGLTVILATRDPEIVFEASDRAAVLFDKEVVQTGTPRELYEHPDSVHAEHA